MSLSALKLKKLTAAIGTCLVLGASGPLLADTQLVVENDGLMLSAFVGSSSDVVLSMSLRIIGPDGFVLEKRVEDSVINWIPEGDLADGIYHWEAWTVTAGPGAQPRDFMLDRSTHQHEVSALGDAQIQSAPFAEISLDDVPVERFFRSQDKQVIRESGSFRVNNGWLEELKANQDDSLSQHAEPTGVQKLVGALLDRLIPTAHADTFNTNVIIEKSFPTLEYRDTDAASANSGRAFIAYFNEQMQFQIRYSQTSGIITLPLITTPIAIQRGAANNSIFIRGGGSNPSAFGSGFVGMGTNTPTEALHISRAQPQIRLENTSESQSWYVRNSNAGRFEISANSAAVNPFTIATTAPDLGFYLAGTGGRPALGIGTDSPQTRFQIVSDIAQIALTGTTSNTTWSIRNRSADGHLSIGRGVSTGTVLGLAQNAPNNSLRIDGSGNIGIGTASPSQSLHIQRADNTAQILVQDDGALDGQSLFNLRNNGHPSFRLQDTSQSDVRWQFATSGTQPNDCFIVNKIGSGTVEMRICAGGDLEIAGTLSQGSSRSIKENIIELNPASVLAALESLPLAEWSYQHDSEIRHFGPMAEDFYAAFGLGNSDKRIAPGDLGGIAMAATKGLLEEKQILEQRVARLEEELLANKQ